MKKRTQFILVVTATVICIVTATGCPPPSPPPSPDYVLPGDANNDGKRNMLDLYAIIYAMRSGQVVPQPQGTDPYKQFFPGISPFASTGASSLDYPPQPLQQMGIRYKVNDWGISFPWQNQQVDFKHADCNLDQQITDADIEYLEAVLDPMVLDQFLYSPLGGLSLTASFSGPIAGPLIDGASGEQMIEVPFAISLYPPIPASAKTQVLGVAFSRPVGQVTPYSAFGSRAYFNGSDIFPPTSKMIWRQKFWDISGSVQYSPDACIRSTQKVLDVGLFNLAPKAVSGSKLMDCGVTLIDVFRQGAPTSFNVMLPTINGVLFVENNNNILPQKIKCTADLVTINTTTDFCREDVAILDGKQDWGTGGYLTDSLSFSSPDIWVRHSNTDGFQNHEHQSPLPSSSEYVYVRIHNRHCDPVTDAQVSLYWAKSSTAILTGDLTLIGTQQLPIASIPAWGNEIVKFDWQTPGLPTSCTPGLSLIAVIGRTGILDHFQNLSTTISLRDQVRNTNNIAMHALTDITNSCASLEFTNPGTVAHPGTKANIWIEQVEGPTTHPLSSYGKVELSGFPASWPGAFPDVNLNTSTQPLTLDPGKVLGGWMGVPLTASDHLPIKVHFTQTAYPASDIPYRFRIWIEDVTDPNTPITYNSNIYQVTVHH